MPLLTGQEQERIVSNVVRYLLFRESKHLVAKRHNITKDVIGHLQVCIIPAIPCTASISFLIRIREIPSQRLSWKSRRLDYEMSSAIIWLNLSNREVNTLLRSLLRISRELHPCQQIYPRGTRPRISRRIRQIPTVRFCLEPLAHASNSEQRARERGLLLIILSLIFIHNKPILEGPILSINLS